MNCPECNLPTPKWDLRYVRAGKRVGRRKVCRYCRHVHEGYHGGAIDRRSSLARENSLWPVVPGKCLIRECPHPAEAGESICAAHRGYFRPRCPFCGMELTDGSTGRGHCGNCRKRALRAQGVRV